MDTKQRQGVRSPREQLLTLVNVWDPVGLLGAGAPRSEYEPLIDALLLRLSRNTPKIEIAGWLEGEINEQFGVTPQGVGAFVNKAVTWFEMVSREEQE
jgi:hypothetical protein